MSTQLDDFDNEQDDNKLVKTLRDQLKEAQKELKELSEVKAELQQIKQVETIREAGLQLNPRQIKALLATAEEVTVDGIRSAAEELGFIEAQSKPDPQDVQAQRAFDDVRKGTSEVSKSASYEEELSAARSKEEIAAVIRRHGGDVVSG